MKNNYTPAIRRIAKTDRVIISIIKEAALIEDHKIINTHAYAKLLICSAWFETRMKSIACELEKYKS